MPKQIDVLGLFPVPLAAAEEYVYSIELLRKTDFVFLPSCVDRESPLSLGLCLFYFPTDYGCQFAAAALTIVSHLRSLLVEKSYSNDSTSFIEIG